ncbi:MAG: molybdopterin molybdotransferase MoeA [Fervidicoccaceae archaeon]
MQRRKIPLKLIELSEALSLGERSFSSTRFEEEISVELAMNRILAEELRFPRDFPSSDISFYDGFALRSEDTFNASPSSPVILRIVKEITSAGECVLIGGGSPVPQGADAVLRLEEATIDGDKLIVKKPIPKGEGIVRRGSDGRGGEIAIPSGRILRAQDLVLVMELGRSRLRVLRRPIIGIAAVGSDLISRKAQGISYPDSYSFLPFFLLSSYGFEPHHIGIFPDDAEKLANSISSLSSFYDAIILVGGASVGEDDPCHDALLKAGRIIFHGIKVSPGKVSGMGIVGGKPVFLVPAHIGSAMASLLLIVIPLLSSAFYGTKDPYLKLRAKLMRGVEGRPGVLTFRTARVEYRGEYVAEPISKEYGGSLFLTSITRANGFFLIEPGRKLNEGEVIELKLFSPPEALSIPLMEKSKEEA